MFSYLWIVLQYVMPNLPFLPCGQLGGSICVACRHCEVCMHCRQLCQWDMTESWGSWGAVSHVGLFKARECLFAYLEVAFCLWGLWCIAWERSGNCPEKFDGSSLGNSFADYAVLLNRRKSWTPSMITHYTNFISNAITSSTKWSSWNVERSQAALYLLTQTVYWLSEVIRHDKWNLGCISLRTSCLFLLKP